ncbi:hypothetical protein AB3480_33845 [Rhizobium mongolense]|uniref:hypothetical protein n=1 Tax=Rhizobium mongolense TaxID=57676 RepID=UPI0034A11FED
MSDVVRNPTMSAAAANEPMAAFIKMVSDCGPGSFIHLIETRLRPFSLTAFQLNSR